MILLAAALGAAGAAIPFLFIRHKAAKRIRQFEQHFPEAIDLIARALRAGHALTSGLGMVADEMRPPIGTEFRLLYDRQNFGMPLPEALRAMANRIPLVDVRFFVAAALTQRESGGNLAEVLDNMSAIMRERFVLKRHVRVVSAHGRVTGWVLGGLPVALAGILTLVAPGHMSLMWTDPLGQQMVMAATALQVVGALIIRRIVNIDP
jgi:tight adherence protein B